MPTPIRIVAAVPDQNALDAAVHALTLAGFAPGCNAAASETAFIGAIDPAPDLILCQSGGPELDARRVLALLGERGLNVPVVVGARRPTVEDAVALMKLGAADYSDATRWDGLGRAAREALQHSQGPLLDRVPHGIIEFDQTGVITFCNQAFANMTGYGKHEIIGRQASGLASTAEEAARLTDALGHGEGERPVPAPLVTSTRHKDGHVIDCLVDWDYERDPQGKAAGGIAAVTDITQRRRAEGALRRSELQFRAIIEHIPVMVDAIDEEGTIILWNHECERVTGYTASEIVGNPKALELLYPDEAYRERKLDEWRHRGNAYRDWPWTLTCKDGTQRTVSWSNVSAEFPIPGWAAWKTGIDVTEQRQLERQIIDIGAREKRRIGRNLHDRLGQHLTGIMFKSELLARDLAKRGLPEASAVEEIQALVGEAIEQTRDLARGLSPVRRSSDGLMLALRGLSVRVTGMFGVPSSFVCEEPVLVHDKAAASHLYWIAHEAVTNAIKHASPGHIEIGLSPANGGVTLTVDDDGRGFAESARDGRGMGLQIMEYRARMIEGLLSVGPRPGGGTRVMCVFKEGSATQP